MDIDSIFMIAAFGGYLMMPFWAKWWNAAFAEFGVARTFRVVGVLVLSLVTLLITNAGPWVALMVMRGTLHDNLSDPRFPIAALMLIGPGIVMQSVLALHFALRTTKISK